MENDYCKYIENEKVFRDGNVKRIETLEKPLFIEEMKLK